MKMNPISSATPNSNLVTPTGIHHVTAIASEPQANIDFYAGLLGLRLIKKTVNFDDPSAYHLYYGDETGSAGTIVTFFYWPGLGGQGRVGPGQMTRLSFSVAPTALAYWKLRLQKNGVNATLETRFGEEVISFRDPDNIPVELVAVASDARPGWTQAGIPAEFIIRGLHTAELTVRRASETEPLLTREMGYRLLRREGNRARFEAGPGGSGHYVDVIANTELPAGLGGVGTVHHIAWAVPDDESELAMQDVLNDSGYHVSDVRDRDYFHSIYYREKAGILFEIATLVPGFAVDEPSESLGSALQLPQQFRHAREQIEKSLPPLRAARQYAN
jgi:glyoxalase family protein